MEIKVVIIDDNNLNAQLIEQAVLRFKTAYSHKEVYYSILKTIKGRNAYEEGLEFIRNNGNEVDIFLIDYNLNDNCFGTDLFVKLQADKRIYKVIHSETDESFTLSKEQYRVVYNDFAYAKKPIYDNVCFSKRIPTIQQALEYFESKILNVKLFGNKSLQKHFFINDDRIKDDYITVHGQYIKYFDILFIRSLGKDEVEIYFQDANGVIDSRRKSKLTLKALQERNLGFAFKRASNKVLINLLWVSKINILSGEVFFIQDYKKSRLAFKKQFQFTPLFYQEVLPIMDDIAGIHVYFL